MTEVEMENKNRAIWGRTCEGCEHVMAEPWARGKTGFRCGAPGPNRGYHIGTERLFPYIPAWCPREAKAATRLPVASQERR